MKIDPTRLITAHLATLVDASTGKARWQDYALFYGIPVAALGVGLGTNAVLSTEAAAGLLTVAGLLGAFLFGVLLQTSERAMDWADSEPARGPETSRHATFLGEIAANAGYASLVAIVSSVFFVVASVSEGRIANISTSVGLAVGLHTLLVLVMIIVRIFALTQGRLNKARTNPGHRTTGTVTPLDKRRTG